MEKKIIIWEVVKFCHLIILGEIIQKLSMVVKNKKSHPSPRQLSRDDIVQQCQQFDQVSVIMCFFKMLLKLLLFLLYI